MSVRKILALASYVPNACKNGKGLGTRLQSHHYSLTSCVCPGNGVMEEEQKINVK